MSGSTRWAEIPLIRSYLHVIVARRKAKKAIVPPLLGYLPFLVHTAILVGWLRAERHGGVSLVHDARLLPFLGYWGMRQVFHPAVESRS